MQKKNVYAFIYKRHEMKELSTDMRQKQGRIKMIQATCSYIYIYNNTASLESGCGNVGRMFSMFSYLQPQAAGRGTTRGARSRRPFSGIGGFCHFSPCEPLRQESVPGMMRQNCQQRGRRRRRRMKRREVVKTLPRLGVLAAASDMAL